LQLPAEGRQSIEAELDTYSRFAAGVTPPPSATKKKLEDQQSWQANFSQLSTHLVLTNTMR
jgi:hypothetical protein